MGTLVRTLVVGEVYGETCVDGLEEQGSVSGTGCIEQAVCKVERSGWQLGRRRSLGLYDHFVRVEIDVSGPESMLPTHYIISNISISISSKFISREKKKKG